MPSSLPPSFTSKKTQILSQLSVPVSQYDDLSPKGSIDEGIRELIDEINSLEGYVTTSSCAGRVAVFVEGRRSASCDGKDVDGDVVARQADEDGRAGERGTVKAAGVGGKGGGGRWVFVSHDPVPVPVDEQEEGNASRGNGNENGKGRVWAEKLGMVREGGADEERAADITSETRWIHFKFEPMILHILTASLPHAQLLLSAALQSGFRESGALNLASPTNSHEPATPMVAVRSMGLGLESVVGYEKDEKDVCMVPEWQLRNLVAVANGRFVENKKRIERFRELVRLSLGEGIGRGKERRVGDSGAWESKEERRERKRAEGLRRARETKKNEINGSIELKDEEIPDIGALALEQNFMT